MDTLDKLYQEIEKLYRAEDGLSTLLEHAGYDTETKYTQDRLELYDNLRDLYRGLQAFLENHQDTINTLEYALEPLPLKIPNQPAMDAMADELLSEKIMDAQDILQEQRNYNNEEPNIVKYPTIQKFSKAAGL